MDKKLLEILACPKCKGELEYKPADEKLLCWTCRLGYRIEDDIPVMLIDKAEQIKGDKK
ncbi:MAG: Trm112 family protein [Candidatus Edwardsbacteria bacterium]|nr:Trm112 family protein [Candidatus Edwardsbacteria bacterium]